MVPEHFELTDGIAEDEEAGKANHSNRGTWCLSWIVAVKTEVANRCEDQETYDHPSAATHQRLASAEVLNDVKTQEGAAKVDAIKNHLSNKGRDLDALENCGAVVEEVVGWGTISDCREE